MPQAIAGDAVATARRHFFDRGSLPDGLVAAPILRAWWRCASHGLKMAGWPGAEPLTAGELRALHDRHDDLRRLSKPEIETLRADAKRTGSVVILTDAAGTVLDMAGSTDFADRAARVALRPGVPWSEEVTGTNAIGTALVERRPIVVHGAEHFFEPHRILACAAVPIIDPRGTLVGVLDMSGHAAVQHLHALGLVRLAAEQIEHRFFEQRVAHCTVLRFHRERDLLGTSKEGILVFEGDRLVAANRHGLRLANLEWSMLDRVTLDRIFPGTAVSGETRELRGHGGESFLARVARPKERVGKPVWRPAPPAEIEPYLSAETEAALTRAVRLLEADIPVLVHGETGTGKEVFARRAHTRSARAGKPFVAVNCAAVPEGLIESELFGYESGAFTGARRQGHVGLLRQADGGVLFLDEIGDMPLALQGRLLRVLQDKAIVPLGGGRPITADFALICATHRPLNELVAEGGFRQDLYFRIAHYAITLPPVRCHPDRLSLLRGLWRQLAADGSGMSLAAEAERLLAAYDWPGNFRQLVGTLRALLALGEPGQPVEASALPLEIAAAPAMPSPAMPSKDAAMAHVERPLSELTVEAMQAALAAADGNVSRAARSLRIDRSTIYRRLLWEDRPAVARKRGEA